jgi:hypothetical protein
VRRRSAGSEAVPVDAVLDQTGALWCALAAAVIGLDRAAWRTAPASAVAAGPAKTPITVYHPEG